MKARIINIMTILFLITVTSSCKTGDVNEKDVRNLKKSAKIVSPQAVKTLKQTSYPFRFVVMADCRGSKEGINEEVVIKTLENIKKLKPQPLFAIMPGDLVGGSESYDTEKSQMQYFRNLIIKYNPINFYYPGFGNHEAAAGEKGEQAFEEIFPEIEAHFLEGYHKTVYYFDKYNIRFYMLNSNHYMEAHEISDTQLRWIKQNTDKVKTRNFYFFHEPAFPTGAHIGNSLDVNKLQRDKLWKIINGSVKPMVFCGHEHNYTRRHIDSNFNETIKGQKFKFTQRVYQVTTGTFGAPIYRGYVKQKGVDVPPIPEYHYAIVDADNNKVNVTVYNLSNKMIDHFRQ